MSAATAANAGRWDTLKLRNGKPLKVRWKAKRRGLRASVVERYCALRLFMGLKLNIISYGSLIISQTVVFFTRKRGEGETKRREREREGRARDHMFILSSLLFSLFALLFFDSLCGAV